MQGQKRKIILRRGTVEGILKKDEETQELIKIFVTSIKTVEKEQN